MKKVNQDIPAKIFRLLKKNYPAAGSELHFKGLYQLFVSVVLSAQCTDKRVNQTTPVLFQKYGDFAALAAARPGDVMTIIRPCGLYKSKAKNLIQSAGIIAKKFSGKPPAKREQLEELPGIGRKSASVILGVGFQIPAFPVDTHVGRICRRLGWSNSPDPKKVEEDATRFFRPADWMTLHHALIHHGRTICKAQSPLCPQCPIGKYCPTKDKIMAKKYGTL